MKKCFKCNEVKPIDEFYAHKEMADGHLGKCKVCTKKDAAERQVERADYIRSYEKARSQTNGRKQNALKYMREMRAREPDKYKARCAVSNALRDGRLFRSPCEACGSHESQAHHHDYSKPLDVIY